MFYICDIKYVAVTLGADTTKLQTCLGTSVAYLENVESLELYIARLLLQHVHHQL